MIAILHLILFMIKFIIIINFKVIIKYFKLPYYFIVIITVIIM